MKYWEERNAERALLAMERNTEKVIRDIVKLYKIANNSIQREIKSIIGAYSKREGLDLETAKEFITNSKQSEHLEKIKKALDKSENLLEKERLRALYNSVSAKFRITRLEEKQHNIALELYNTASKENKNTEEHYIDVIKKEADRIIKNENISVAYTTVNPKTIERIINTKWYAGNFSSRIWQSTDKLERYLNRELREAFINGKNPNVLKSKMAKAFKVKQYESSRLLRTESNYFHNQTTLEIYKDSQLEEYKILATLDQRTSRICRKLNGKRFKVNNAKVGENYPPLHPFCRSTVIPVISGFDYDIEV